ncbi:MAG: hypothetical protein QMD82_00460 [bacterium]|nr:hypothetical protein [bacterium]
MLTLILICQILTPEQVGTYISHMTKASRMRNMDSLQFYYKELRKIATPPEENFLKAFTSGLAIFLMITSDSLYAKEHYIDSAMYFLEECTKFNTDFSDAWAVLGAIYGMKAIKNLTRLAYWGKKSNEAFRKAKLLDPQNPRAYYLEGISLFFRPKALGGGVDKAQKNFKKALEFYLKEKNPLSWGYLECKAFLGFSYEKANMKEEALKIYDEILRVDSNYEWVKRARKNLTN